MQSFVCEVEQHGTAESAKPNGPNDPNGGLTMSTALRQDAIAGDLGLGAGPMTGGWKAPENMGKFFT